MAFITMVENMTPGSEGFMVPWRMYLDVGGEYYLDYGAGIYETIYLSSTLRVKRLKYGEYVVDSSACKDYGWERVSLTIQNNAFYRKVKEITNLPVLEVNTPVIIPTTNIRSRKIKF